MQKLNLDTRQLYIVSSDTLREFVVMLLYGQRQPILSKAKRHKTSQIPPRLIHEKILITNLLNTIAIRNNCQEPNGDNCSTCCASTSSVINI